MLNLWMYWVHYECGEEYGTVEALCDIDPPHGYAYGMYQFDYRYGLVPMLQTCCKHNPTYYNALKQFIALGKKNKALVNNKLLQAYFRVYASENTKDFLYCQNKSFIDKYFNEVKANAERCSVPNLNNPYILGALGSMAIRDGASGSLTLKAINAMTETDDVREQIRKAYNVFDSYFYPKGDDRWSREMAKCLQDYASNANVNDIESEPERALTITLNIMDNGTVSGIVEV